MKEYNCPDCKLDVSTCYGCPRLGVFNGFNQTTVGYPDTNNILINQEAFSSDPCQNCPNNPANGGPGNCNCTLGGRRFYV